MQGAVRIYLQIMTLIRHWFVYHLRCNCLVVTILSVWLCMKVCICMHCSLCNVRWFFVCSHALFSHCYSVFDLLTNVLCEMLFYSFFCVFLKRLLLGTSSALCYLVSRVFLSFVSWSVLWSKILHQFKFCGNSVA